MPDYLRAHRRGHAAHRQGDRQSPLRGQDNGGVAHNGGSLRVFPQGQGGQGLVFRVEGLGNGGSLRVLAHGQDGQGPPDLKSPLYTEFT